MYRVNSGAGSRPVFQQGVRLYAHGSMPLGSTSNSDSNSTQIRENPSSSSHQPLTHLSGIVNVSKASS
ncbi:unnamed protein product [Rodentolepis nana]|uniref:Uncharacterized protein n=1 Tax=Rodentolepis nana TaxID=102285 RepID=A0A0R3U0T9_RODNA|nr:unnamed protein product [Rodentolepis nana]VDO16812.1 unnamed protein product [Rodentolepis nana]